MQQGGKGVPLADDRVRYLTLQLDSFFKGSNPSLVDLHKILQGDQAAPSAAEAIIDLFTRSISRPMLCKALDKAAGFLQLDTDDNLAQTLASIRLDPSAVERQDLNVLHQAIMKNYAHLFKLLLLSGCNPNSKLSDKKTPLSIAVVSNHIEPTRRLEYIRLLMDAGADPLLEDINSVTAFERLCGLESNYPSVYLYFRDHLLSTYPDRASGELNGGLLNALFNWSSPIVTDLLEHGAILVPLQRMDSFTTLLHQLASTIFVERRSTSLINPLILCLIEILRYGIPCDDYSVFIEQFFQLIYIPGVCSQLNSDPENQPSLANMKKLLHLAFHYGYLSRGKANEIRTAHIPLILEAPIRNPSVMPAIRQNLVSTLNQYFDELDVKYYRDPPALTLLAIRRIRQSVISMDRNTMEKLDLAIHMKGLLLGPL